MLFTLAGSAAVFSTVVAQLIVQGKELPVAVARLGQDYIAFWVIHIH